MLLFSNSPRFDDLEKRITARFAGKEVPVGEIEEFVLAETLIERPTTSDKC